MRRFILLTLRNLLFLVALAGGLTAMIWWFTAAWEWAYNDGPAAPALIPLGVMVVLGCMYVAMIQIMDERSARTADRMMDR